MQPDEVDELIAHIRHRIRDVAWGKPHLIQMMEDIADGLEKLNNKSKSCPVCALKDAAE